MTARWLKVYHPPRLRHDGAWEMGLGALSPRDLWAFQQSKARYLQRDDAISEHHGAGLLCNSEIGVFEGVRIIHDLPVSVPPQQQNKDKIDKAKKAPAS